MEFQSVHSGTRRGWGQGGGKKEMRKSQKNTKHNNNKQIPKQKQMNKNPQQVIRTFR